jgi:magnesium transporter
MIVDCAVYEHGRRSAEVVALEDTYEESRREGAFAWIDLREPTEAEFESVRREFNFHELAVEDAIKAHQRPKLEVYDDLLFVVLKTARWTDTEEMIVFGQILLFVGETFIVSVTHGDARLQEVRAEVERRPDLLAHGPYAALYAVVDRVVDDYGPVLDQLDEEISNAESAVFSSSSVNPAALIYRLKREVLELHSALSPLVTVVEGLTAGADPRVDKQIRPYFRDVHDHLLRADSRVHVYREALTSVLMANQTQASMRQNEDVRKISAWAAIIAVPTLITGIYGMNFEHMPELGWTFGYPLALFIMALACFLLYRQFRRVGWL